MEPGIFAKTFPGSDPQTVLAASKAAGYRTVQYNMVCSGLSSMPEEVPESVTEAVRLASEKTGVGLCAVSGTFNMVHPDMSVRETGLRRLGVLARSAKAMGTGMITLCTGTRDAADQWRGHPENDTPEAWRDLLRSMETAVRHAEENGVFLGVEPELANVVSSAAAAKRLITELQTDRIKIVFDPANLFEVASPDEQRRIISEGLDLLAPHIAMAHAKDRQADGSFTTAGTGVLDYRHFLKSLTAAGFSGPLVTHGLDAEEAPGVAAFLSDILEKAV